MASGYDFHSNLLCHRREGALCDTAIRPSVLWRSCTRRAAALGLGTLAACSLAICGLRTRPRTKVDQLRVELPSAGEAYRLVAPWR